MKPFAVALASAVVMHAAAAGSFAAFGVARGTGTMPAIGPSRTVDVAVEAAPVFRPPAARPPSRERRASRGASNAHCLRPAATLAPLATTTATTSDAAPQKVPTPDAPARFAMTVSNDGAAPPASGDARETAVAAPAVLAETSVTTRARRIGGADPAYPAEAAAQGIERNAPLAFEIVVDPDGRVRSAHELGRAGYGFDEAAAAALESFRFSPARRNGKPVWVRMRWTVEFRFE